MHEARGKAMKWVIASLGLAVDTRSIHALSLEQCEQAIRYIADFRGVSPARSAGFLTSLHAAPKF
jgi:hypothetical protein